MNISGGNFEGNKALDGGVVYVGEDAALSVEGGVFTENVARNGGGVFWTEDGGDIEVNSYSRCSFRGIFWSVHVCGRRG